MENLKFFQGAQALPISVHEMEPRRAFPVLQKWPNIAKMTPNDLLTPEMGFTEPPRYTVYHILNKTLF